VDLVVPHEQGVDQRRSDEAGTPRDHRPHGRILRRLVFITFEGLDGCGKTTQALLLAETLSQDGVDVVATREPGGTPLGDAIRDLVLHGDHVAPWAEAALYTAARAQHVEQVIRPALERSATVVCDRYLDTSVAYQGAGRGLGTDVVLELNLQAVGGLLPDRTILVDLDVETALARVGDKGDRIERAGADFWPRVVEAYHALAERFAERYVVVDGARPVAEIAEEIRERLR
jgi:dTMP kinase